MTSTRRARVFHVAASNQRRGAEVFAADLILHTSGEVDHRMLYMRPGAGATVTYACPARALASEPAGWRAVPRAAREVRAEVRSWQPDVVVAHGGESFRAAAVGCIGTRVPVVYRRIGMAPASMRRGWRRQVHRGLIRRAALVVCLAEVVRTEVIDRFRIRADRTLMIPNAVDPARLVDSRSDPSQARTELGLSPDARIVLSLCALSWEKDPLGMLDVTAPVLRAEPDVSHVFAGDGPLRDALVAKIVEFGLEHQAIVLGARDDVGRLLAATDVLLFASRPLGMEGMPTILIEAGLVARPVVAAAVPGVVEVVVDGETGMLVPPGDVDGLRRCLQVLLDDPDRREAYGKAALAHCEARFTIEKVTARYVDLWKSFVR